MRYLETLTVQPRKQQTGSANQVEWVDDGDPVTVAGNAHPLDQAEIVNFGDVGQDLRRWFCRSWPGDMHSVLTFEGDPWEQAEPAARHKIGRGTRHVEVVIRRRSSRG